MPTKMNISRASRECPAAVDRRKTSPGGGSPGIPGDCGFYPGQP